MINSTPGSTIACLVAEDQIVQHYDFAALRGQQADGVGADVSSASGDKNRHLFG
jgi:hypothetical protein